MKELRDVHFLDCVCPADHEVVRQVSLKDQITSILLNGIIAFVIMAITSLSLFSCRHNIQSVVCVARQPQAQRCVTMSSIHGNTSAVLLGSEEVSVDMLRTRTVHAVPVKYCTRMDLSVSLMEYRVTY